MLMCLFVLAAGVSPTEKFVFTGTGATPSAYRTRVHTAIEEQTISVKEATAQKRYMLMFMYVFE